MLNKPSQTWFRCRALDGKHCEKLHNIIKEELRMEAGEFLNVGYYQGHEEFISNCSNSFFLTDKQKEQLCKQDLQVLLRRLGPAENIHKSKVEIAIRIIPANQIVLLEKHFFSMQQFLLMNAMSVLIIRSRLSTVLTFVHLVVEVGWQMKIKLCALIHITISHCHLQILQVL